MVIELTFNTPSSRWFASPICKTFKKAFEKAAVKRTKFSGLKRNIDFFKIELLEVIW